MDKITLHERVAKLEQCYEDACKDLEEVRLQVTNHIPHKIEDIRNKLNNKLNWLLVLFVSSLVTLILNLVSDKI